MSEILSFDHGVQALNAVRGELLAIGMQKLAHKVATGLAAIRANKPVVRDRVFVMEGSADAKHWTLGPVGNTKTYLRRRPLSGLTIAQIAIAEAGLPCTVWAEDWSLPADHGEASNPDGSVRNQLRRASAWLRSIGQDELADLFLGISVTRTVDEHGTERFAVRYTPGPFDVRLQQ